MPSAQELLSDGKSYPLASALDSGVANISQDQSITFSVYTKFTLPTDGSVFWLKSTAPDIEVLGSLHYATNQEQNETDSPAINSVIFTARQAVQDFNLTDPDTLYIATLGSIRFSFTGRKAYYQQADLHHYYGDAVYPVMASQIIDNPASFSPTVVVSNSLPLWLALNEVLPVYAAFLVPQNATGPYVAVFIDPARTLALTAAPALSSTSTHTQQCRDTVRLTVYGANNSQIMDYVDYLYNYFENYCEGNLAPGLAGMIVATDAHRTQSELGVIAQKKILTFDVNYYQQQVRAIARQLIKSAVVNLTTGA